MALQGWVDVTPRPLKVVLPIISIINIYMVIYLFIKHFPPYLSLKGPKVAIIYSIYEKRHIEVRCICLGYDCCEKVNF